MTVGTLIVPEKVFGISSPLNVTPQGTFVLHDVQRAIYAQMGGTGVSPVMVGYIPATADGVGGIYQLARAPDIRYNSNQSTTGFGASGSSQTSVTVSYPAMSIMFDGAMQSFSAGSLNATVSAGTYSFGVAYKWGLTQFVLQSMNVIPSSYIELCTVTVTTTSATVGPARMSGNYMRQYGITVGNVQNNNGIPVSDANGNMTW